MALILKIKKHPIFLAVALLLADLLLVLAAKILHRSFTGFALVFFFFEAGCVLVFFWLILCKNLKITVKNLLKLTAFMAFGTAVFSTLTYGQANIHSDTAMASYLVQAQIKHVSLIPKSWYYTNGDIIFLDNVLTILPFELLLKDQVLARMMGSALIMILAAVSLVIFDKKMLKSGAYVIAIPVIFVFLFGGNYYLMWGNDFINYQACITSWLIMIPLMLGLSYHLFVKRERSIPLYILYAVLSVLLYIRGLRAIAELLMPLLGAYAVFWYFGKKKDPLAILFVLPPFIGCLLYKVVSSTHSVIFSDVGGTVFAGSQDRVFENILKVFRNMFDIFGYNPDVELASVMGLANITAFLSCLILVFVLPLLQFIKWREETEEVRFFLLFVFLHNLEMFISTVFFDKSFPSHIFTFVLMSVLVSAHYIMKHLFETEKVLYGFGFMILCIIMSLQLGLMSRGWAAKVAEKRAVADILIEHGLDKCKGYGGFWNIYPLGIYSDLRLDVAAIGNSDIGVALTPYRFLVDSDRFVSEDRGSYIIFNYNENEELGATVESVYGECTEKFEIGESHVYVWDYDICVNDFGGRK